MTPMVILWPMLDHFMSYSRPALQPGLPACQVSVHQPPHPFANRVAASESTPPLLGRCSGSPQVGLLARLEVAAPLRLPTLLGNCLRTHLFPPRQPLATRGYLTLGNRCRHSRHCQTRLSNSRTLLTPPCLPAVGMQPLWPQSVNRRWCKMSMPRLTSSNMLDHRRLPVRCAVPVASHSGSGRTITVLCLSLPGQRNVAGHQVT